MAKQDQVVLSAVGKNRSGVLAELTAKIAQEGGNIMDIGQKIIGDYFCTLMMVEIPSHDMFGKFKESLEGLGKEKGYRVFVQHEKVFQKMHRV
ncbi:MAG: ACT domain-containing protein [Planctomycetota bacterium]|nr:MAG: ACT domain-containing protein [Planctomycetota bacterium]